ncbi:hypothetical protein Q7P37_004817 [Cladosporium fusiforme]
MDSPPSEVSPDNGSVRSGHHKKRVRVWTEDDRAKHRVFEKSRREAFSDSLLSLARFLPSLATVKESKLSKHTIVDESLKYHELQNEKLDELQKSIDVLKAEKESLLVELSQWRRCLDTPPQQVPVTAMPGDNLASSEPSAYELPAGHNVPDYPVIDPGSTTTFSGPLAPGTGVGEDLPMAPTSFAIPRHSFPTESLDTQQLDAYTLQQTALPVSEAHLDFSLLPPQAPTHSGTYQEPALNAAMWPPQCDQQPHQTFMPQQSYCVPLDSQRYQF